jgi:hypothetical protein
MEGSQQQWRKFTDQRVSSKDSANIISSKVISSDLVAHATNPSSNTWPTLSPKNGKIETKPYFIKVWVVIGSSSLNHSLKEELKPKW